MLNPDSSKTNLNTISEVPAQIEDTDLDSQANKTAKLRGLLSMLGDTPSLLPRLIGLLREQDIWIISPDSSSEIKSILLKTSIKNSFSLPVFTGEDRANKFLEDHQLLNYQIRRTQIDTLYPRIKKIEEIGFITIDRASPNQYLIKRRLLIAQMEETLEPSMIATPDTKFAYGPAQIKDFYKLFNRDLSILLDTCPAVDAGLICNLWEEKDGPYLTLVLQPLKATTIPASFLAAAQDSVPEILPNYPGYSVTVFSESAFFERIREIGFEIKRL